MVDLAGSVSRGLTGLLPQLPRGFPDIEIFLDLTSRSVDLIAEQVDPTLVATRLGAIGCTLCATPD
jgi:hypothetical protein